MKLSYQYWINNCNEIKEDNEPDQPSKPEVHVSWSEIDLADPLSKHN